MSVRQIRYNGKQSFSDYQLRITDISVGTQTKREVSVSIPYMNGNIDLSMLGGKYFYENVPITVAFFTHDTSLISLYRKVEAVKEWLYQSAPQDMYDSLDEIGHFQKVTCTSVETSIDKDMITAELTATFTAYPYKLMVYDDIPWDNFNFAVDCMNADKIEVTASPPAPHTEYAVLHVYNVLDTPIVPRISYRDGTYPGIMSIIVNEQSYDPVNYYRKTTEPFLANFELKPGDNEIRVIGYGTLEFIMEEELLC